MSEFESFRCMISSEDSKEEGPAFCAYPKCWLEECPHKQARDRLAEADALCIKLAHQKGGQVDELRDLNSRLAKAKDLLVDNYPCYGEDKCKNCVGDFGEIDFRTCVGYNVLKALRGKG